MERMLFTTLGPGIVTLLTLLMILFKMQALVRLLVTSTMETVTALLGRFCSAFHDRVRHASIGHPVRDDYILRNFDNNAAPDRLCDPAMLLSTTISIRLEAPSCCERNQQQVSQHHRSNNPIRPSLYFSSSRFLQLYDIRSRASLVRSCRLGTGRGILSIRMLYVTILWPLFSFSFSFSLCCRERAYFRLRL